ncbi:uncharacterized protein JN550_000387 [Neoarthrinium moseri]|uniref:uncharacterized protein n=1 Tax=Neoarthrinium moseri TaxID=1658444 RepID=UPI001FDD2837|nr:uncharacterized protein JN550_000387 [Neoarthrinium moseri]KAI1878205.1 hypothetical protein JN550_000387 [Neoarthrinium moseri]
MFSSLLKYVNNIALGAENRSVSKYLDEATCVSADLGRVLSPQLGGWREQELLQATFDKFCYEGSSQQKYWNDESFRKHVRSRHSVGAMSDAAIQLLWLSFHFYAYHPFPRDCLLGTRELDWFWQNDAAFFRRAGFERIFRSIAAPETTTGTDPSKQQTGMTSSLSDTMDVLVMVGPQFMHAMPSPAKLEPVARRLFAERSVVGRRAATRDEVSTLVSLLLRLRLEKEIWGFFYHLGDILEAGPEDERLTEAMVNSLAANESQQTISSEWLLRAVDLMPNLRLRFHQLWAVLFQPLEATDKARSSQVPRTMSTHPDGATSLFAPCITIENGNRQIKYEQDTRITLEEVHISPGPEDMALSRLTQCLSHHSSAHVVLFTSDASAATLRIVIGAYIPDDPHKGGAEMADKKCEFRDDTSLVLFQLQPRFRLLQRANSGIHLSQLIRTGEIKVAVEESVTTTDPELLNTPYWIGNPSGQGTGLRIDPRKNTATLICGDERCDMELKKGVNTEPANHGDITIQNARMFIFMVAPVVDRRD